MALQTIRINGFAGVKQSAAAGWLFPLIMIGLLIDVVYIIINRFIVKIPTKIAIPVLMAGIACLVIGFVQMKQIGVI